MDAVLVKLREVLFAVLPVTAIVLILNFTLTPLDLPVLAKFLISAVMVVVGLTTFLLGVDIGIAPIGNSLGSTIAKTNKLWMVIVAGLALGFFISVAEPDLHILAGQVETVTSAFVSKMSIVVVVSVGIAALLASGLLRIVYNVPLYKVLTALYGLVLILALFTPPALMAISFDASGATTGALTVPFIMCLGLGISELKKDSKASEKDSFGLVGLASVGPIIAVMAMGAITSTDQIAGSLDVAETQATFSTAALLQIGSKIGGEVALALLPILMIFLAVQGVFRVFSRRAFRRAVTGVVLTFAGLVLFLTGVNAGFMDVGAIIGYTIASLDNKMHFVTVGFVVGCVTVLAEPAVHVLTHQIEDVTSGYVKRNMVLVSLVIAVGIAVGLSMLRILVSDIQLWHYLLPGYAIAIAMSHFAPKLFVGIGFDAGGVASGPMTATFILAYANGAAEATKHANVLVDGFGMIAMVALMPIIALQALGLLYKVKSRKVGLEPIAGVQLQSQISDKP